MNRIKKLIDIHNRYTNNDDEENNKDDERDENKNGSPMDDSPTQCHNEITAVIGPILSGKSTLINFISDKLKIELKGDDYIISKKDLNVGPEISETYNGNKPIGDEFEAKGLKFIEFPAFNDNTSLEEALEYCLESRKVIGNSKVKLIFVYAFDMMKNNPYPLMEILSKLDKTGLDVCLIATKAEKGNLEKMLNKLLKMEFNNAQMENATVIKNAQNLLKKVLKTKNFYNLFAPKSDNTQQWNQDELLKVLQVEGGSTYFDDFFISSQSRIQFIELNKAIFKEARELNEHKVEELKTIYKQFDEINKKFNFGETDPKKLEDEINKKDKSLDELNNGAWDTVKNYAEQLRLKTVSFSRWVCNIFEDENKHSEEADPADEAKENSQADLQNWEVPTCDEPMMQSTPPKDEAQFPHPPEQNSAH